MNKSSMTIGDGDALVLVDMQNDFLPGGAMAVEGGDAVISPLNSAINAFHAKKLPVIATRDWHPQDHSSFQAQGGPWPPHCVQDSWGASFSPRLNIPCDAVVISTGAAAEDEGYSGFEHTRLDEVLKTRGIRRLFVGGLATDYCVVNTVVEARERGYEVVVLTDAIRPVEANPGDGARAEGEMKRHGAIFAAAEDLFR